MSLTGDHTLIGKVFKGKYYSRSFVAANYFCFALSYARRSILSDRDLISKGSQWRIGNRENVKVGKNS